MVRGPFWQTWQQKSAQKRGENGILAVVHTFFRAQAYLALATSALATPLSCSRVHTPYVHLLATFARFADLSCSRGSQRALQKGAKTVFWTLFAPSDMDISACRAFDLALKLHKGAHSICAHF